MGRIFIEDHRLDIIRELVKDMDDIITDNEDIINKNIQYKLLQREMIWFDYMVNI